MLPSGSTLMLDIGRPPHRLSDRLFTSLADPGRPAWGGDCGIGVGRICERSGGGSVSDATCPTGGMDGRIRGTGARRVSIIARAPDLTPADIFGGGGGSGLASSMDLEAGAKMAALAVPVTATRAKANARRFMEAAPITFS